MDKSIKISILERILPDETFVAGKKNVLKILNRPDIKLNIQKGGADIGYVEAILIIIQAVAFLNSVIDVYEKLVVKNKENANNKIIVNFVLQEEKVEVNKLSEKQLENIVANVVHSMRESEGSNPLSDK